MSKLSDVSHLYLIRRKDTGEYFRQSKGPSWAKCSGWVKESNRAKSYGNVKSAWAAVKATQRGFCAGPPGTLTVKPEIELVVMKVVEEGTLQE